MSALVEAVKAALRSAEDEAEYISPEILAMDGMSGRKYRRFINSLIRRVPNPRYLEIGAWKGSTLCAAASNNELQATVIDNWSEFGGPAAAFQANVAEHAPDADIQLLNQDFLTVDYAAIGKHNVYFYDGPHAPQMQYFGITKVLPALDDEFVLIVDDWGDEGVRDGTIAGERDANLQLEYSHPKWGDERSSRDSDWHNGCLIAVVRKP